MNRKHHSFTLVELITIVVAAVLLATILLPCIARADVKAKLVSCISNLKSCAQAANQYSQNNEGKIYLKCGDNPRNQILYSLINGTPVVSNPQNYLNKAPKYLKGYEEACCPDIINPLNPLPKSASEKLKFSSYYAVPYMSYKQGTRDFSSGTMMNYVNIRNIKAYDNPRANNIAAIELNVNALTVPAEAILFAEAWRNNSNGNEAYWHYSFHGSSRLQLRHDNKTNIAFADGHVDALGKEYFKERAKARYITSDCKLWDATGSETIVPR